MSNMRSSAVAVRLLALVWGTLLTALRADDSPEVMEQMRLLETMVVVQKERIRALEKTAAAQAQLRANAAQRKLSEEEESSIFPDPITGYGQSDDGSGGNASLFGALDHLWLIVCAALVVSMQAGFACVEAGVCRFRNVQNILLKNQIDVCVSALGWYFLGYSFAYGESSDPEVLRVNRFAGMRFAMDYEGTGQVEPSREFVDWFFQWAFCATAATIVSGGVAERVNFPGYVIFTILMTTIIYPSVVAWTWGTGWLYDHINDDINYYDFAGSGIVHMTGGVAALVAAAICGARKDRFKDLSAFQRFTGQLPDVKSQVMFEKDTPVSDFEPHSIPLQVFGTYILWFGWYGFNCGSTLGTGDIAVMYQAALVATNTTLSACVAGIVAFTCQLAVTKKFNIQTTCNGILAGLVSITAGCANVESGSAVVIGIVGGILVFAFSGLVKVASIDDPIDAFAVHGVCGIWGVFAAAFFDMGKGFDAVHAGNGFTCITDADGACKSVFGQLIGLQLLGIVSIAFFSGACTAVIFTVIRFLPGGLYTEEIQTGGADPVKHSPMKAYSINVLYDGTYGGEADTNRPPIAAVGTPKSGRVSQERNQRAEAEGAH